VCGLYMDRRTSQAGVLAGMRLLAESPDGSLTVVGSDDGAHFWALTGSKKDGSLEIDFSPLGGRRLRAASANQELNFEDGSSWALQSATSQPAG